jgi:hypothetical protein
MDKPTNSTVFIELLGPELLNKDGELISTESLLKNKYVALYFSAHWYMI